MKCPQEIAAPSSRPFQPVRNTRFWFYTLPITSSHSNHLIRRVLKLGPFILKHPYMFNSKLSCSQTCPLWLPGMGQGCSERMICPLTSSPRLLLWYWDVAQGGERLQMRQLWQHPAWIWALSPRAREVVGSGTPATCSYSAPGSNSRHE